MENFLMNLIGVAAIVAMLCGMWIMWRNIDRELEQIERGEKRKAETKRPGNYRLHRPLSRKTKVVGIVNLVP